MLTMEWAGAPAWNWLPQVVGLCTAYAGAELNARQRPEGFALWIASNAVLSALHLLTGLWLLFVLDLLFFRVNVIGLRRWHRARSRWPANKTSRTGTGASQSDPAFADSPVDNPA